MGEFRNILTAAIAAGWVWSVQAQTHTVNLKGTVLDSRSGVVLSGATVSLAGNSSIKATTDAQGNYTLSGQVVGALPGSEAAPSRGMSLTGGEIHFQVAGEAPVTIEVYSLDSRRVKTLVNARLASGDYRLTAPTAGLPAGAYVVRGRIGAKSASFKVSSVGITGTVSLAGSGRPAIMAARLAKSGTAGSAAQVLDTLKVVREGYASITKPISMYVGIYQIDMHPKLAAGDLKIVSERGMPQVNWGLNVDVQVWDGTGANGTQLRGNFPNGFEGPTSWMVKFVPGQSYSAWGFIANAYPEDMSAWANGSMHIAVKGTVPTLGVTMASANQQGGSSIKVDVTEFGYKPDNVWHELSIPLSKFTGTDFSQVSVYCGLVTPGADDTIPFNTDFFYQVDDIYWKTTK